MSESNIRIIDAPQPGDRYVYAEGPAIYLRRTDTGLDTAILTVTRQGVKLCSYNDSDALLGLPMDASSDHRWRVRLVDMPAPVTTPTPEPLAFPAPAPRLSAMPDGWPHWPDGVPVRAGDKVNIRGYDRTILGVSTYDDNRVCTGRWEWHEFGTVTLIEHAPRPAWEPDPEQADDADLIELGLAAVQLHVANGDVGDKQLEKMIESFDNLCESIAIRRGIVPNTSAHAEISRESVTAPAPAPDSTPWPEISDGRGGKVRVRWGMRFRDEDGDHVQAVGTSANGCILDCYGRHYIPKDCTAISD